jgi:hypothetical protein
MAGSCSCAFSTWAAGQALHNEWDSIEKVATGKKPVTPTLALRVAGSRAC